MRWGPAKHRGTELMACVYLLGEGYDVFRNISAAGTADLIACKADKVLRIDVKSGNSRLSARLRPEQESEGVVFLHVDEKGCCEFEADRRQRIDEELRRTLTEIVGLPAKEGAEQLNQRGITTPSGAQWSPGTVVQMRDRVAL